MEEESENRSIDRLRERERARARARTRYIQRESEIDRERERGRERESETERDRFLPKRNVQVNSSNHCDSVSTTERLSGSESVESVPLIGSTLILVIETAANCSVGDDLGQGERWGS